MANATTVLIPIIDAQLYAGTPNTTGPLPPTTLVNTVQDVSLKLSYDKPEANNRKSRIKQKIATLVEVGLEISFAADTADSGLAVFKTAAINAQPLPVKVTDGLLTFVGLMGVESLDNDQPLAGVSGQKFGLFPWAVGAGGTQPALS